MLVASTSVVGFGFRNGKLRTSKCFPICPRKRTSSDTTSMSALCQKRPRAGAIEFRCCVVRCPIGHTRQSAFAVRGHIGCRRALLPMLICLNLLKTRGRLEAGHEAA